MRKISVNVLIAGLMLSAVSCDTGKSNKNEENIDTLAVDTLLVEQPVEMPEEKPAKEVKKQEKPKADKPVATSKTDAPKQADIPDEIGASPDAVFFLDNTETETAPKYTESDKILKKTLKEKLRKAQKGEKATFRVSMVIKKDGSVGRVQFTSCGYSDEYKPEIIAVLQTLSFIPGTKDGKAVDSWYYLTWKR